MSDSPFARRRSVIHSRQSLHSHVAVSPFLHSLALKMEAEMREYFAGGGGGVISLLHRRRLHLRLRRGGNESLGLGTRQQKAFNSSTQSERERDTSERASLSGATSRRKPQATSTYGYPTPKTRKSECVLECGLHFEIGARQRRPPASHWHVVYERHGRYFASPFPTESRDRGRKSIMAQ